MGTAAYFTDLTVFLQAGPEDQLCLHVGHGGLRSSDCGGGGSQQGEEFDS